ncbi:unnamed protein product, partial [marine sediment metagenome]
SVFFGKPDANQRLPPEPLGLKKYQQRYRGGTRNVSPMFYKPEIRQAIRAKRKQMDPTAIQQASKQAAAQLIHLPGLIESKTIAFYLPNEGELDPYPIIQYKAWQDKQFYLPVVEVGNSKKLAYYPYHHQDPLIENRFGIQEPSTDSKQPIDIQQLDIILLPLVSFDKHCNRIGRGAGYYDRTLAFVNENSSHKRPLLIGLGYEFQKIPEIVPAEWDVPLDMVITEKEIYQRY